MSLPLFSVVVPCFNVSETVSETIASISAQTMSDFEIIAVDNNCTDKTVDILSTLAAEEPRLRIVKQTVQGLSAARNCGIRAARGQYIAFVDADDLWDRDYLETHLKNFADGQVGISYSPVRMIDMAGQPTGQVTKPKLRGLTATDLLRPNPCTALIVVRADVFGEAGLFDEELGAVEDQEWLFRAAYGGAKLSGIDQVLASYRISPGGLSANLDAMLKNHEGLLRAAGRLAPEIVAGNGRLARAAMRRYCARRAMEHDKGADVGLRHLVQMVVAAPEILVFEPLLTGKAVASVLLRCVASWMPQWLRTAQVREA